MCTMRGRNRTVVFSGDVGRAQMLPYLIHKIMAEGRMPEMPAPP